MYDLIVVQRQTLDWKTMQLEQFRQQSKSFCRLWGRPEDHVYRMVELWNNTFGISYFAARQMMKDIATANLSQLACSRWAPYQDYQNIPLDGDAYIFIDDDDWLIPDISARLSHLGLPQHKAALWKAVTFGGPKSAHPIFFWGMNGRCKTNNYVASGQWIREMGNTDAIRQHDGAEKTLANMDVLEIDEWLSITNKHPCSSVSLERGLDGDFSREKMAGLIERYCQTMASIDSAALDKAPWSEALIQSTLAFFYEVKESRL